MAAQGDEALGLLAAAPEQDAGDRRFQVVVAAEGVGTEGLTRGIGGRNVSAPPKSRASERIMFMPEVVSAMVAAHLERVSLGEDDPHALVFTDDEGGALRDSNWRRRVWEPATAAAGCTGAGFHDLRWLNATTLVVEGVDVKTAQTRLGHADPRVTLAIYASAPASVDREAADRIGDRFFGSDGDGPPADS